MTGTILQISLNNVGTLVISLQYHWAGFFRHMIERVLCYDDHYRRMRTEQHILHILVKFRFVAAQLLFTPIFTITCSSQIPRQPEDNMDLIRFEFFIGPGCV
jgi:hypothetical protein